MLSTVDTQVGAHTLDLWSFSCFRISFPFLLIPVRILRSFAGSQDSLIISRSLCSACDRFCFCVLCFPPIAPTQEGRPPSPGTKPNAKGFYPDQIDRLREFVSGLEKYVRMRHSSVMPNVGCMRITGARSSDHGQNESSPPATKTPVFLHLSGTKTNNHARF